MKKYLAALALSAAVAFALAATASAAPTPILLGNAGVYALLAGSGLTNTGMTTVTGDAGSSATSSETGFALCPAADCVALTGANHTDPNPNDAQTQSAKTDLTTAYNAAAGQTPTQIPTELAGTTLTAGVYDSAAGTFGMTGTLVLDGGDNADSIFIFQTGSTLTTGGTGNVTFIRGAQACNVFWQIGSSATLGGGSDFSGTIMASTSITVGNGATVHGRLLAGTGDVTLIHDTVVTPSTCTTQAAINAQIQADRAAAAAREAEAKAAAAAAAQTAAEAQAAAAAAAATQAAAAAAAADKAKAAAATAAAAKAATAARVAKAAATAARVAKAKAVRLATARAITRKRIALKRNAVRAPHTRAGFTG